MGYEFTIVLHSVSKYPKYLKKHKENLTEEILDCVVIFYYKNNKVVFSKLISNVLNIPLNVVFSADFFTKQETEYMLSNFPLRIKTCSLQEKKY